MSADKEKEMSPEKKLGNQKLGDPWVSLGGLDYVAVPGGWLVITETNSVFVPKTKEWRVLYGNR